MKYKYNIAQFPINVFTNISIYTIFLLCLQALRALFYSNLTNELDLSNYYNLKCKNWHVIYLPH